MRQARAGHFPPPDVFEKLPWRRDILEGLLGFGLVGFQSIRDRHNFIACVRRFFPDARFTKKSATLQVFHGPAKTTVGTFPIGIDFREFTRVASEPSVVSLAKSIRRNVRNRRIVLGVDRLDYTKGILERIKAFGVLLKRYPGLHGQVTFIQIAVPSRENIPHYRDLKLRVEQLVSETNDQFGGNDWVPIQYWHRHFSRAELVAFYRAADIALVTPVKDGMNLVCKEFCAARAEETGVLVLSEFAGAANQLKTGALLVNPYDIEGIASVLYNAFDMNRRDIGRRMRRMRRQVQSEDVYHWCSNVLAAAEISADVKKGKRGSVTARTFKLDGKENASISHKTIQVSGASRAGNC
ncbi:MAG TPA: trehalose-6-phosphate synthase [Terriglobales bacterium]|nr:trehalose-6-phosphate synthase [Terriglobales bacterium]